MKKYLKYEEIYEVEHRVHVKKNTLYMICQNTNKSRFKVLVNFRDKLLPFSRCPNLNIERCTLNGFSPSNPFLKSNMQNFEVSDFPYA